MRTTVTLDEDVAASLKAVARERGVSFKVALNDSVRAGLAGSRGRSRPYRTPVHSLGVRPGVDLTHALRLVGEWDDEEIVRKLELGK